MDDKISRLKALKDQKAKLSDEIAKLGEELATEMRGVLSSGKTRKARQPKVQANG